MKLRAVGMANSPHRDANAAGQVDHAQAVLGAGLLVDARLLANARLTANSALALTGAEL